MNTKKLNLPLKSIVEDTDLQMRTEIDFGHVDELKEVLADLPPITVFKNGEGYYIGDGWHRFLAHKLTGKKTIKAIVQGTQGRDEALAYSLGANAEHNALRRTRADIRKAVTTALGIHYFADLSKFDKLTKADRWTYEQIAELCKTTKQTVSNVAKDLEAAAKPKSGKNSYNTNSSPAQADFYDQLNGDFEPVAEGLKGILNHAFFINPEVKQADKVDAAREIERNLKDSLQAARDLRKNLETQEV